MGKVLTAKYDAAANALRLAEPLEGVADDETVRVNVVAATADPKRPWLELEGSLSKEAGEELARAIDEMFPPWNADE